MSNSNTKKKSDLVILEMPAQAELFIVETPIQDWPIKDDISSMEYPIFSLSKKRDTRIRTYSRGGKTIRIIPSVVGAATVFDQDILIYCISQLVKAADKNLAVSRRIKISVTPFLLGTHRSKGGASYVRIIDMCRRLKGTTIETNIKSNELERIEGFGLIEDYRVTQYTKNQKGALELEITISEWLYRAALDFDILTLAPGYFDIGQAMERRLYTLGRKHCGERPWFSIGLPLLKEKIGSAQSASQFKKDISNIIKNNRLPEYHLALDTLTNPNQVIYFSRDHKKVFLEATKTGKINWVHRLLQRHLGI